MMPNQEMLPNGDQGITGLEKIYRQIHENIYSLSKLFATKHGTCVSHEREGLWHAFELDLVPAEHSAHKHAHTHGNTNSYLCSFITRPTAIFIRTLKSNDERACDLVCTNPATKKAELVLT